MKLKTSVKIGFLLFIGNILAGVSDCLSKTLLNITDEVRKIQQEYSLVDNKKRRYKIGTTKFRRPCSDTY